MHGSLLGARHTQQDGLFPGPADRHTQKTGLWLLVRCYGLQGARHPQLSSLIIGDPREAAARRASVHVVIRQLQAFPPSTPSTVATCLCPHPENEETEAGRLTA